MATLKILDGSLTGQSIDLDRAPTHIGRASTNELKMIDPSVSSRHAKIWTESGSWFVMDLGSTNGTRVNGADIDREELKDGDEITFGRIRAKFSGGRAARPPTPVASSAPRVPALQSPPAASPAVGLPSGRESELALELATLKARFQTLEQELERKKQEAFDRERIVAEEATASMKAEMEKLRELMRERDESMRTVESQSRERENWFSPEEVERERKRFEASAQLEVRRQTENAERSLRDLEAKVAGKTAEVDSLKRSLQEKDELIQMLSAREDRAETLVQEREDAAARAEESLRAAQEDLAEAGRRERELSEMLKQKNAQLADFGRQHAEMQQELSKVRAQVARSIGGEAGAQAVELATEIDALRTQLLKIKAELAQSQDELITARSARDQEAARAQTLQTRLDDVQGELTDATDDKSRLEAQVEDLVRKHAEMTEAEQRLAGVQGELDALKARDDKAAERIRELEAQVASLGAERLELEAAKGAAVEKLAEVEADYRVLRAARTDSYDWEARYKSQVDELDQLRRERTELRHRVEELEAGASAGTGEVDESQLAYLRAQSGVLSLMAAGLVEGINDSVSLMRRNSEVIKGYVHDCGLLANAVRQIDYTRLEPDQQRMLRELIDETQPDVIIRNMESIGDENSDATARAKKLILDWQEAMKVDEEGTDLERCFAKSQGLFKAMEPGADVRVKVENALPALPASQSEGVLFAFTVLREARRLAVEDEQLPLVRIEGDGKNVTMMISPVRPDAKERYREALGGLGDETTQYLLGFAREACGGRVDVKDMGDASTMFVTLTGAEPHV